MEQWKDIEGYEELYQISNHGKVRSKDRLICTAKVCKNGKPHSFKMRGKFVAITDNGAGYKIVSLSKSGRKNHYVHRLVATHFIPNPENKLYVNHKDGNKSNNHLDNLEWVTHSENIRHSVKNGMHPTGARVKNSIALIDIETGQLFDTIKSAAEFFEVKYSLLKGAVARKRLGTIPRHPVYSRLKEGV